jgi:transcriptional regulator of acetoin/glycerol metabolism
MESDMSQRRHVTSGDTTSLQAALPVEHAFAGALACISLTDGRMVLLDRVIRIGRGDDCDLVLDDAAASRTHVQIEPRPGGCFAIVDLGSRNGTFVDGARISRQELHGAAIVRVGDHVLRVVALVDDPVVASPGPLVGGTALVPVRRALSLVAPTDLAVLVLGETGTGKDVVARALHDASRRSGAFVAVNCAALPDALVESELFGHARGSFTGASGNRRGLFAEADGGTLFLDEVGELPLAVQAKLLRVLEDKLVRPVGSEQAHRVDVRIVSATNRDLQARALAGTEFRADLFARLAGVELRLPALRERVEDLPALIQFLWHRAHGRGATISANALEALAIYRWPHNIRELDHSLRAAALVDAAAIDLPALPAAIRECLHNARTVEAAAPQPPSTIDRRAEVEAALREHRGNLRRVAHALGIARGHLYRLLRRWELDAEAYRLPRGTGPA